MSTQGLSYKDAGVDIEAGNYLVQQIKSLVKSTNRPGVVGSIGGFGALFDLSQTRFKDKNPILVSGTDGVGTKLKLALSLKKFDTIGIDLVAMCVNDILVQGAEPLFFLDYYACGKLDPEVAQQVLIGIASGCRDSLCALVGGETAEMPGMYSNEDFDLAGFTVGAVEKEQMLPRLDRIADGDVIIGLQSSGVHSNGYSMVRKVLEISNTSLEDHTPFDSSATFGQVLLTPTRLYVKSLLPIIQKYGEQVVALCHITGGGLVENIPRILPEDKCAELDANNWQAHPIFDWLHQTGKISEEEMLKTFNCGLGMVVIVKQDFASVILKEIQKEDPHASIVGTIRPRAQQAVVIKNVSKLITPLDFVAVKPSVTKKRVAVLISGSGTNLQALIDHTLNPTKQSQAEIVLVISNKDNVKGLERARLANIPTKVISHIPFKDNREGYDHLLQEELVKCEADFVFLAGFMRILSNEFVSKWEGRLINIHPALLPSFAGMNTHKRALEAGVQFHGTTVHFVDAGVDTGTIIRQQVVEILPQDTEASLQEKVKQAEHKLYPEVMELLVRNKILLNESKRLQWN